MLVRRDHGDHQLVPHLHDKNQGREATHRYGNDLVRPHGGGSGPAIERVFAHPDTVRAVARAPVTFGRPNETREGSDGVRLAVDGKILYVFETCGRASNRPCEEAPPGVRAAIRYLGKQPIAHDPRSQWR